MTGWANGHIDSVLAMLNSPEWAETVKRGLIAFDNHGFGFSGNLVALTVIGILLLAYRDVRRQHSPTATLPNTDPLQLNADRLSIGGTFSPYISVQGDKTYALSLAVYNKGATDSFMIQVRSIQPPPTEATFFLWSLQWEGTTNEFQEILHEHPRTLHCCRLDPLGELHDPQTGNWKPMRIWFFTPEKQKEIFLATPGIWKSEQLLDLRITVTLCITIHSTEEKLMWQIVIGFEKTMVPYIVQSSPI